jgi:hypothetical protein
MCDKFYVYMYNREDGTPYYIGKGSGNGALYKGKNEIQPPKDKTNIILIQEGMDEESAYCLEKKLIDEIGRKDLGTGVLRNMAAGWNKFINIDALLERPYMFHAVINTDIIATPVNDRKIQ